MNYLLYNNRFPLVLKLFFEWISNRNKFELPEWNYHALKELYDEFLTEFGIEIDEGTNGSSLNYLLVFKTKKLNELFSRDPIVSGEYSQWEEPYENAFQILQNYLKLNENKY